MKIIAIAVLLFGLLPHQPVHAQAQAQDQAQAQVQQPSQAQWLPVEAAAVKPLTSAEAALWPDEMLTDRPVATSSLGTLLRLLQPRPDAEAGFPLPVADAAALRHRVAEAVTQASPTSFAREPDGRFITLASASNVTDALADTITTAMLTAGQALRQAPASRWAEDTKGLLRALHDPQVLEEARRLAAQDSKFANVDAVRVVEAGARPASLWLSVQVSWRAAAERPRALIARVNLDDVLSRVARPAP